LYACWKLWYFGDLLPNSFYVKVAQSSGLLPGRGTVRIFYGGVWYLAILAVIAVFASLRAQRSGAKQSLADRADGEELLRRSFVAPRNDVVMIAALWCILLSVFYSFSQLIQPNFGRFTYSIEVMLII